MILNMHEQIPKGESSEQTIQKMVADGEQYTVEQWRVATSGWTELTKEFVRIARSKPYEERQEKGLLAHSQLIEVFSKDPNLANLLEIVSSSWQLSDQALDRMIESFHEKEGSKLQRAFRNQKRRE
jgi:hypothetical protein